MSLSTMHLPAQVWPTWLPGAVTKAEQRLFSVPRGQLQLSPVKHQTLPPLLLFSAAFQTSLPKPSHPRALNSPLLSHQRLRPTSRIPPPIHQPISHQLRAFTTSPTSPPPKAEHEDAAPLKWTPPSNISIHTRPVTIIGAGVLGRRLAVIWASDGSPVTLYDTSPDAIKSATTYIADTLSSYCSQQGTHPGKIHFTTSLTDACTNPWMCIEAVPESIELKISMLGRIDRAVPTDCIIATNSSSFKSSELYSEVKHRERVLNTLYYIPPENKCVELMPNPYTSPLLPPFLTTQLRHISLSPITIHHQSTGLIFPRLWAALKREALCILQEGVAKPEEIDELFRDYFAAKKGVCEKMDEVGLDTVADVEKHFLELQKEKGDELWRKPEHLEWLEKEFVEKGRLGNKTGHGLLTKEWVVAEEKTVENPTQEVWKEHATDLSGL